MTAVVVLAAVHLAVLGLWFLPRSVWEWLQATTGGYRLVAMFRAVPMALAAAWFSFGILAPVVEAELGTTRGQTVERCRGADHPFAVSPGVCDVLLRMANGDGPTGRPHGRCRR